MNFGKRVVSVVLCSCMVVVLLCTSLLYKQRENADSIPFMGLDSLVVWYTDEGMTDYMNAMAVAFHEHYDIRVIPQLHSGFEYLEDIYEASVSEEKGPDLYIISNEALEKAYLSGLAVEITDKEAFVSKEHFPEAALNAVTYHGKKVGYPYYFETSVLLYNKTYIEEMAKNQILAEATDEDVDGSEEESETTSTELQEQVSQEAVNERVDQLIPDNFDELLSFADSYDAPQAVEAVFKWDVEDIFYNYFFVGNYLNVGGPCGDESDKVDIYNLDVIKAMQIYQNLNQFFSFESEDVAYASVIQEFIDGKLVFTTATSDVMKTLQTAKEEGNFAFEYGLVEIPDLNAQLQTKNLSVTNTIVVNGYSDKQKEANQFATYLAGEASDSLYEKTGKIPANTKLACKDDKTTVFYNEYSDSIPVPKMMVTSNLWVQMEVTFAKVWSGFSVSNALKGLSEMIMSQITGSDYVEEYIDEPDEEQESIEYLDEEAEKEAAKSET